MARENAEAKARRYIGEGRLTLIHVDARQVLAKCKGGGEEYVLGYRPGGWWCNCPALGRCSHLLALMLVTVRPSRQEAHA
jgi:uncharacterized Zn finger protein